MRAAIYAPVSTDKQADTSPEGQMTRWREYRAGHGSHCTANALEPTHDAPLSVEGSAADTRSALESRRVLRGILASIVGITIGPTNWVTLRSSGEFVPSAAFSRSRSRKRRRNSIRGAFIART